MKRRFLHKITDIQIQDYTLYDVTTLSMNLRAEKREREREKGVLGSFLPKGPKDGG